MKHRVYICKTDADYHIPDDDAGVRVFFSMSSIKRHISCWEECGVVELQLDYSKPRIIVKPNPELARKNAKTGMQIYWESIYKCPKKIYKDTKQHLSDLIWGVKSLISVCYYRIYYRFKNEKD